MTRSPIELSWTAKNGTVKTQVQSSSDAKSAALLDPGLDLNMENGMAEHVKDAIILTSAVQILAVFSNYCWLGLLFAPLRGGQMLWSNVISPWIFAPPPEENIDEKKQKKLERKMKRGR